MLRVFFLLSAPRLPTSLRSYNNPARDCTARTGLLHITTRNHHQESLIIPIEPDPRGNRKAPAWAHRIASYPLIASQAGHHGFRDSYPISICRGFSFSAFGTETVRTPLSKRALIPSGFTVEGRLKLRKKRP